jgi:hypothetical protein
MLPAPQQADANSSSAMNTQSSEDIHSRLPRHRWVWILDGSRQQTAELLNCVRTGRATRLLPLKGIRATEDAANQTGLSGAPHQSRPDPLHELRQLIYLVHETVQPLRVTIHSAFERFSQIVDPVLHGSQMSCEFIRMRC